MNSNKNKKVSCFSCFSSLSPIVSGQAWLKLFWLVSFFVALFFVVIYFQRYMASRQWQNANNLVVAEKYQEADIIYSNIYSKLKWNGRFLAYYGNNLLQMSNYVLSIKIFEDAKRKFPHSDVFEKLAMSYAKIENIKEATNNWMLAINIQPWRLTPKYYLADLFFQIGDTNNAIKYARLVVNTPMKKWSERGKNLKIKSQKMLIELDQKCDDQGLVVFDINDKSTWNEGKW